MVQISETTVFYYLNLQHGSIIKSLNQCLVLPLLIFKKLTKCYEMFCSLVWSRKFGDNSESLFEKLDP